jgi:uncharacterized protein involved in cysteine biosynthesis
MNNEGSGPKSNPEEESVINRKRPKLKLAELKNKPERKKEPVNSPLPDKKDVEVQSEKKIEKEDGERVIKKEKITEIIKKSKNRAELISLKETIGYVKENSRIIILSLTVSLIMIFISIFLYHMIFSFMKNLTDTFYSVPPLVEEFFDYFHYAGWVAFKFFFKASTTIFVFYSTFLIGYLLLSPLYSFISYASENTFLGKPQEESDFDVSFIGEDYLQAIKITAVALFVTVYLFFINFVPVIGQIVVFISYPVLNALLIADFSASRKEWSITSRFLWIKENPLLVLIVGGSLTIVSIIPQINNIVAALLVPFFIAYTSLNIAVIEKNKEKKEGNDKPIQ